MIPVRKNKFDFSNTEKYYYRDSKLITHFFNALSSTFPPGEDFFVRAVRAHRKNTKDDLEKDISGFIGQEAWHSMAHKTMNLYAETHNVPLTKIEDFINVALKQIEKKLTVKQCLAVTVALEHYTASMGMEILNNPKWLATFDEPYKELIKWHSSEEIEHRHVAFDVYMRDYADDYKTRIAVMIGASIIFWVVISIMTCMLYFTDKDISAKDKVFGLLHGAKELLGPSGFVTNILKDLPIFFKKDFHPNMM